MKLVIYSSSDADSEYSVWPNKDPIPPGIISECGTYYFELRDVEEPLHAELLIDDLEQEALRSKEPYTAKWKWSPGFHAGVVEASIKLSSNRVINFSFITDPDIRKLTRRDYDNMVSEILEDTFALFSLSSFRNSVGKGSGSKPPPIARLEFIRSRISKLVKTVKAINNKPQRRLSQSINSTPYYKAKNVTGVEVAKSFQRGKVLTTESANCNLPKSLKGFFPANIQKKQIKTITDIREHREIKAALTYWSLWLLRVEARISRDLNSTDKKKSGEKALLQKSWVARIRGMRSELKALLALPLFSELPNDPASPKLSSIYRNVPSYREFYKLYRDLNLGIANVFGEFLDLPLARTFDLYEIWCFLRLLRAALINNGGGVEGADKMFDSDPATDSISITAEAVSINVGGDLTISFQRRYSEYWLSEDDSWVGSFSRTMVPDIVLSSSQPETNDIIVLDAKYRIEQNINDAVSSIHTYRDAIVQGNEKHDTNRVVKAAYLLSPGIRSSEDGDWEGLRMPGRLFHPTYRSSFKFGAVVLKPGMQLTEVREVLNIVLNDAIALN